MINLRAILNSISSKIKGKPYAIDESLSNRSIFYIATRMFLMYIRGALYQIFSLKIPTSLFIGKNVKIRHRHKILFGSGCIFHDNVTLCGLSKHGIQLGKNVTIPESTYIRCTGVISDIGEGLKVGSNTGFGHFNFINAQGGVSIGSDVIIGPHVKILAENHQFQDPSTLIRLQGVSRKGIHISDNVWIGAGSIILDGVELGTHTVVAAGSVVTKSFPANVVIGGVPAKVISNIKNEHQ